MTACLTYSPLDMPLRVPTRGHSGPAGILAGLRAFTGLSNESRTVESQTADVAISYLNAISFSLPLEIEFQIQATEWKQDTRFCSSPEIAATHPAYQRIIGMGPDAVPLILREIEREPGLWFDALMAITGEQPVREVNAGDIEAMCADWITWGRRNGFK